MTRNSPPPAQEEDLAKWERFKEEAKARAHLHHFEGAVEKLEALCLLHAPEPGVAPERYSDGWYANEILLTISAVRTLLVNHPRNAAAEALRAGSLAGNWPAAQRWREQQEARRRGGLAPKHLPGLQAAVDRLVTKNPEANARELWDMIPESDGDPIDGFIVYRDGSKVIQVDDKTGQEKPIVFRSFGRYVTRARSK